MGKMQIEKVMESLQSDETIFGYLETDEIVVEALLIYTRMIGDLHIDHGPGVCQEVLQSTDVHSMA